MAKQQYYVYRTMAASTKCGKNTNIGLAVL